MSNQWHYSINGKQEGPIDSNDLKALVRNGTLKPNDMVWREGISSWVEAANVKGLFAAADQDLRSKDASQNDVALGELSKFLNSTNGHGSQSKSRSTPPELIRERPLGVVLTAIYSATRETELIRLH